jgi:hypothetical protein
MYFIQYVPVLLHLPPLIFILSEDARIEGSGAVQTITDPGGPKTCDPTYPEHRLLS